ncbi:MAG: leucine-rich repeat domain-containing protein [Chitinophagales bacterium]|nr:leucine-rich repeat domain-containing protein [Chitinophagales bacterium]
MKTSVLRFSGAPLLFVFMQPLLLWGRRAVLSASALLIGLQIAAAQQANVIGVVVSSPGYCAAPLPIDVEVELLNLCYSLNGINTVTVNGNAITITIGYNFNPGYCASVVVFETVSVDAGYLMPGIYSIAARLSGSKGSGATVTTSVTVNCDGAPCSAPDVINLSKICSGTAQVCGCDGVTYANACTAFYKNGITSWTSGPCATPCGSNPAMVTITGGNAICNGASATLTANATGSTGPYTYVWSNAATTSSIAPAPTSTTTYTVTVTSSTGCTATSSRTVTVAPAIAINNITTNNLNGTFRIQGGQPQSSGGNYSSVVMALFNNPAVTATLTTAPFTHNETVSFTVPQSGAYVVTVTDGAGCTGTAMITPVTCNPVSDSLELVKLYNATGGPGWTNTWNLNTPVSTWYGVQVNVQGCVRRITLPDNKLNGILPDFMLPNLYAFDCRNNQLSGNIPNYNLPNLVGFVCSTNQLSGSIPNFNLPNLQQFDCYFNQLNGSIPNFNLPNLQELRCQNNQLSSSIPNFNLPNLQEFYCHNNQLVGSIPNFNLPNLEQFICYSNQLSGSIPDFDLPNLQLFWCYNNQLSGSIPNFKLPKLTQLRLRNNQLSSAQSFTQMPLLGTGTSIFDSLTLQNNHLTFEDILPNMPLINGFFNNQARYAPQDSIFSDTLITRNAGQTLTIDLGIDAAVPDNIYAWYKNGSPWTPPAGNVANSNKLIFNTLQNSDAGVYHVQVTNPGAPALTLYSRAIRININTAATCNPVSDSLELVKLYNATGGPGWTNKTNWLVPGQPISSWYGVQVNGDGCVITISLSDNQLSGSIPNFSLPNLQYLWLNSNQLSGSVPDFSLPNLQSLSLSNNQLSGSIPNFSLPNLQELWLSDNQLNGLIPNFNLPNLRELWLSDNQLSGSIPNFSLPSLQSLNLAYNDLTGLIPNFSLPSLRSLYLAYNQLSGSIPNFNLPNLQLINFTSNQLSGSIPNFSLLNLQRLYLTSNQLSGSIPIFNLPNLQHLWLNNNQLGGSIPNFNLPKLIELRLEINQLSGPIPNFSLPNLQELSLSYNQLSGSIPNFSLPKLIALWLRNNNLSTAPAFTQMPLLGTSTWPYDSLTLQYNHLTFDDILPNTPLLNGFNGARARYAPQDSIFSDTLITRNTGQALTIDLGIDAAVPDNIYAWYKNGSPWTPPAGNTSNSNKLIFSTLQNSDAGVYHVQVTNPGAPALTLYSRAIRININTAATCNPVSDSLELVKLYNATNGPGWTNTWNLNTPVSTWYGVTVNGEGCVTQIDLAQNLLTGNIPNLNLPDLEILYLFFNQLSGNIPDFNLPNLKYLTLSNNQLSGSIPNFNLPNLEELLLFFNELNDTIPNFNLPKMKKIILYNNQLVGQIPNFNLPNLETISFYKNKLTGNVPDFNLPMLKLLVLSDNKLSGSIPNFNLPNLQGLSLFSNQLSGSIPNFNLPNLYELSLSSNQLIGSIPNFNLPNLSQLFLSSNQLSDTIANFNLPNLQRLSLSSNQLSGSIPNFSLPKLRSLWLSNNNLSAASSFNQMPLLNTGTWSEDSLTLQFNHLTFDDILPNMPLINGFYNNQARYAPQDSIFSDTLITRNAGQALTIDLGIDAGLTTNVYQWHKNGSPWTPPAGNAANSNKLIFNALQNSDAGVYHVQVTNPGAPALTLYSRAIQVEVQGASCPQESSITYWGTIICTDENDYTRHFGIACTDCGRVLSPTTNVGTIVLDPVNPGIVDLINVPYGVPINFTFSLENVNTGETCGPYNHTFDAIAGPTESITSSGGNVLCSGETTTLAIPAVASATYTWYRNGVAISNSNANQINTNQGGTYEVTWGVFPAICVSRSIPITLTQSASPTPALSANTPCPGGTLTLQDDSGTAIAWSWSGPQGYTFGSNPATRNNMSAAFTGTYSVTATNAEGCTATSNIQVAQIGVNPIVNLTPQNATCDQANGSINLAASGGNGPFSFDWEDLPGSSDPQQRALLPAGNYSVTVSNAQGCTASATTTIDNIYNFPELNTSAQSAGCNLNTGSITLTIQNGIGPFVFEWSNGSNTQNLNNVSPDVYTVTVTGSNGCTASATDVVDQMGILPFIDATAQPAACGQSNGSITLTVSGGTTPFNYDWADLPGSNNPQNRTALPAGTYTVTVTNAEGCTASNAITVGQSGVTPVINATTQPAACGQSNGSITLTVSGGTAPFNYDWADLPGSNNPQNRTALPAGTYTVTVTSAEGCTASNAITVGQSGVTPVINATTQPAACGQSNGSITLTVSGGTAPFNYDWADLPGSNNPQNRTALPAGTYTVTVTNAEGCTASNTIMVGQSGVTPVINTTTQAAACGQSDGSINLSVSGGTAPFNYDWADLPGSADPQNRTAIPSGNYTVTVTNAEGCTSVQNITVAVSTGGVNLSRTEIICGGDVYVAGNQTFSTSGTYTVILPAQGAACDTTLTLNLSVLPPVSVALTASRLNICKGDSTLLKTTVANCTNCSYQWSNNNNSSSSQVVAPESSTTYKVTVTQSGLLVCKAAAEISISVSPNYELALDTVICAGYSVKIGNQLFSNTGLFTVELQTGQGCDSVIQLNLERIDPGALLAFPDTIFLVQGSGSTELLVTENDTLPNLDSILLAIKTLPLAGDVAIIDNRRLRYSPPGADFLGTDVFTYTIGSNTCPAVLDSARVTIIVQGALEDLSKAMPNVITPNGDGMNDDFDPLQVYREQGNFIPEDQARLIIINRMNEVVHVAKPYEKWIGTYGNQPDAKALPSGVYKYVLELSLPGQHKYVTGAISIAD